MAKNRSTSTVSAPAASPEIHDQLPPGDVSSVAVLEAPAPAPKRVEKARVASIARFDIPLAPASAYPTTTVEIRRPHSRILAQVAAGLQAEGARLANGKPVESVADAVGWIAEQIAASNESAK